MDQLYCCHSWIIISLQTIVLCFVLYSDSADGQCSTAVFSCPFVNGTDDPNSIQFAVFSTISATITASKQPLNTQQYTWRFGTQRIVSLLFFNGAWSPTLDPLYQTRVLSHSEVSLGSGLGTNFSLTIGNMTQGETNLLVDNSIGDTSNSFPLNILECNTSEFTGASSTDTGVCGYNCIRTFICNGTNYIEETLNTKVCLSDARWNDTSGCTPKTTTAATTTAMSNGIVTTDSGPIQGGTVTTSRELGPGAIAGIVIGTVVGVCLILFLIWWFIEAFRSCLHDISDCFPEDRCCGKEYSKGSSS